ncbi:MAG TPA: hypothetical protein VGG99_10395 [Acetobacteraceae bacterium]|jgi:hypothetical protein
MRSMFWLCMFVACAGSAQACGESHSAVLHSERATAAQIAGSVWIQPRPAPGSLPWMPDFTSPLLGPHGGHLADGQIRDKTG